MEENEIRELVGRLNQAFNIQPCGVRIGDTPFGMDVCYVQYGNYILISPRHLDRITPSLVCHEYAHHLAKYVERAKREIREKRKLIREMERNLRSWNFGYTEYQKRLAAPVRGAKKKKRRVLHGREFIRCLRKVIEKAGIRYDFSREYVRVRKALEGEVGRT